MNTSMKVAARLAVLGTLFAVAIPLAKTDASDKEPRFPQLKMEDLNDQQRPVAEDVMKVSSIGLGGPYNLMLRSPLMADRMLKLLDYLRFNTTVPRKLNEFAILIQARLWTSQVEWHAHYPLALKAGLAQSVADDLKVGKRPASMQPDEAAVYDYCMELSTKKQVSDATFQRLRKIFSEQQIVDLMMVSGTYNSLAMMLSGGEQGLPPGTPSDLQPIPGR
jgi:4-carboxymuconolactone decarboxylase